MKLSQLSQATATVPSPQHVLIFGPPKAGKTQLAGGVAEEFKIIYFGLERGHATLYKLPLAWQERVTVINLPDTKKWPIAAETMKKVFRGGKHTICEEHGKIACMGCLKMGKPTETVDLFSNGPDTVVIIDSLTQLTTSIINHVTKDMDEEYKLEFDDWGELGKHMGNFLTDVQQAPFHVIAISHETTAKLEDGKERIVPVAGTRNFSRNTAKYFDHVVYAEVKNGKHQFGSSTTYNNNIMTGSRTGSEVEKMKSPSLLDIMKGTVTQATPASPTPGAVAVTGLNALKDKLKLAAAAKPTEEKKE
jgi:hypothetical protein